MGAAGRPCHAALGGRAAGSGQSCPDLQVRGLVRKVAAGGGAGRASRFRVVGDEAAQGESHVSGL